jgi:hypothetical protein
MPDTERKPLPGHPARGPAAASGCASAFLMAFGVPFMSAGILIGLIAAGRIHVRSSGGPPPEWLPWALAVIFFVPGLFLFSTGVRSLFEGQRTRRLREQHPTEPWLAEGEWDPEGTTDRPRTTLLAQVSWLAFLSVFLTPFNYFVFVQPRDPGGVPFWVRGLVVLFDLIPLLMIVGILTTLWHAARYGRSHLRFGAFPFHLGGTLDVRFSTRRPIGSFEKMTFTLRCVEERTEVRRTSKGTSTQTVCDQVWADERVFESSWALQDGEVPVSFRLPEGDYGTRLALAPARYWELEVAAVTPGLDFGAVFPVPVYTRPRA